MYTVSKNSKIGIERISIELSLLCDFTEDDNSVTSVSIKKTGFPLTRDELDNYLRPNDDL